MVSGLEEWEELEAKVEIIADELGVTVEEFVAFVCRYRKLIRALLSLCEV